MLTIEEIRKLPDILRRMEEVETWHTGGLRTFVLANPDGRLAAEAIEKLLLVVDALGALEKAEEEAIRAIAHVIPLGRRIKS